jgi:hypothetical protein
MALVSASALGLLIGCVVSWLVWSTHIPAHYPRAAFSPVAAVLMVYFVIVVPSLSRSGVPLAIRVVIALLGALLTLVAVAVPNEMILCHYAPDACINL